MSKSGKVATVLTALDNPYHPPGANSWALLSGKTKATFLALDEADQRTLVWILNKQFGGSRRGQVLYLQLASIERHIKMLPVLRVQMVEEHLGSLGVDIEFNREGDPPTD